MTGPLTREELIGQLKVLLPEVIKTYVVTYSGGPAFRLVQWMHPDRIVINSAQGVIFFHAINVDSDTVNNCLQSHAVSFRVGVKRKCNPVTDPLGEKQMANLRAIFGPDWWAYAYNFTFSWDGASTPITRLSDFGIKTSGIGDTLEINDPDCNCITSEIRVDMMLFSHFKKPVTV